VELLIPISIKADMSRVCRKYQIDVENQGGLSIEQQNQLISDLEEIGLVDVDVSVPEIDTGKFGEDIEFHVKGNFHHSRIISIFNRAKEILSMDYRLITKVRRVVN